MPTPDLAALARLLANRWSDALGAPVAVRLTLPHLVLLASQPRMTLRSLERVAEQLVAEDPAHGSGAIRQAAVRAHVVSAVQSHVDAITAALRDTGSPPGALLDAWELAASEFDPASDGGRPGHDAAGHPWMPTLGGLHAELPMHAGYGRLGTAGTAGHASPFLLLALAGEAGYQRLLTDPAVLTIHTGLTPEVLALAALDLEAEGWIGREVWAPDDGAFPRILWVAPARHHDVFRGLGVVSPTSAAVR